MTRKSGCDSRRQVLVLYPEPGLPAYA